MSNTTKRNPHQPTYLTMTVEVHSIEKTAKATGNKFRSYFATAVGGEELAAPMNVVFTRNVGKPRAAHAILTIDPLIESTYGRDKYTGKTAIFIADPYTEKPIEPRKTSRPLTRPSEWTDGDSIPVTSDYVPQQYGGEQLGFESIADDEALPDPL